MGFTLIPNTDLQDILKRANTRIFTLAEQRNNLVVCNISPQVGHGIFTSVFIPAKTILCEYLGEYTNRSVDPVYGLAAFSDTVHQQSSEILDLFIKRLKQEKKEYPLDVLSKEFYNSPEWTRSGIADKMKWVSSKHKGNITRFCSHLPDPTEKNQKLLPNIQKANLDLLNITDLGEGPTRLFFITTRDIEPYEQLGFDYGESYGWQENSCLLFQKGSNQVVTQQQAYQSQGVEFYKNQQYDLAIECFTEALKFEPNHATILFNLGRSYQQNINYEQAIKTLTKALKNHKDKEKVLKSVIECCKLAGNNQLSSFESQLTILQQQKNNLVTSEVIRPEQNSSIPIARQ